MFSVMNTRICERNKFIYWMKYPTHQMAHIIIFD
jgi:hypothetical protein